MACPTIRITAALWLALGGPASAQRAVQTPSAGVVTPASAPAEMENALIWGGDLTSHLQGELTKAGGGGAKGTLFDDSDSNLYANYSTWLSLYGNLHLERNRGDNADDYFPASNSFFRSEGLTLRQLFAAVRPADGLTVYGGKIHPNFGSAFASVPGNFYNFAADYEQSERIGLGLEYWLPAGIGLDDARLSVEAHSLDTSALSTSLISQPALSDPTADRIWRYRRFIAADGNTGRPDNWTVALRGGRPESGLTYQLSFERQGNGSPDGREETGGSLGLMYDPGGGDGIALGRRLGVIPFVEYAQFDNFQGNEGQRERYLTGGLAFHYVRWELDVAFGLREGHSVVLTDGSRANGFDHQESLSLNYTLSPYPLITAGFGVNHVKDGADPVNVVAKGASWSAGPSLAYELTF